METADDFVVLPKRKSCNSASSVDWNSVILMVDVEDTVEHSEIQISVLLDVFGSTAAGSAPVVQ